MMKSFENKIVFITGGSSGIGLAAAKAFVREGSHVAIFARDNKRLEIAIAEIAKEKKYSSQKIAAYQCDVANYAHVKKAFQQALKKLETCDILINCAGRAYPARFEDIRIEQFEETMRINMFGIWNTCAVMVPHMKQRGGIIVNTSSLAGFVGVYGYTDYAASKFAIIGFSEALRSELKLYNIFVSVLCPPDTDTPGFQTENMTKPEETKEISKSAKLISPEQVAASLVKGIKHNKFIIIPNFESLLTYYAKRFIPKVVEWVMDRDIRNVKKKRGAR
jgi:short-subunit dehydrogenase